MRGRPRDPEGLHYVVATRVSDEQYQYLKRVAKERHASMGVALRGLIEDQRQSKVNKVKLIK